MNRILFIAILLSMTHCQGPEARRPVKVKSGTFLKESADRNRELLAREEALIRSIIESDSLNEYHSTEFGAWYFYENKESEELSLPAEKDLVRMTYNLMSLDNDTIYKREDIGVIDFRVDREEFFPGLRMGIKLLREGEVATFLFPSSLAYGYHGDGDRIGTNLPLKSSVSVFEIVKTNDSIQ